MSDFLILILIVVLFLCLAVTLFGFVVYSGLLHEVEIRTGSPPVRNVTIAYKLKEGPSSQWGPYKEFGASYAESTSIGPNLSSIGIFYDDPKQRASEKCRYAVGSVLSEGDEKPDGELLALYEGYGFKVFSLPEVTHAVTASFPYTTPVSHVLASARVYPQLQAYIQDRKLSAFPTIEICTADRTHYMVPLSRQTDFFVPEMRDPEVKTELKEYDSDEDRGTDITGADSHSSGSSVSGGAPWDSRETSLAASTAASLASSLPLRDVAGDGEADDDDAVERPRHREHRGSDESMGSGSSFEELDMEPGAEGPPEEGVGAESGTEEGNHQDVATQDTEPPVEPSAVEVKPRPLGGEGEEK